MDLTRPQTPDTGEDERGLKAGSGFWTTGRILGLLVVAAVIVRVLVTLTREMVQFDETAYLRMAQNLAWGNGLLDISGLTTTHFTPLLPMLIAGLAVIVRGYVVAGYIIAIIFSSLILIPTFLLGRDLFDERVGLYATALMVPVPIFVTTSEFIYTEVVYIFFLLMGAFFGWHMLHRGRLQCGLGAGVSLGLAYLANPQAIFYVLVLLALAVVIALLKQRRGRLILAAALLGVTFLVFAAPYIFFLHAQLGKWTYSGKTTGGPIYMATHNISSSDAVESEKQLLALTGNDGEPLIYTLERDGINPVSFITQNPVLAAKTFLKESYRFYGEVLPDVFPLWLLPLLGLGLFAHGWHRKRVAAIGYMALLTTPVLLILAMFAYPRFFMPFVPLAMIVTGAGWRELGRWSEKSAANIRDEDRRRRMLGLAPWLIGVAMLLPMLLFSANVVIHQGYETQYREAGEWLLQEAGPGTRVLNREATSAYYAEATLVVLPYADYDETTAYARRHDVEYFIIGRDVIPTYRPQLARLLGDAAQHPEWKLVKRIRPGAPDEVMIFTLEPRAP
ncbi:MAG: ArnT family glycosyltransferase [Thermoleophilia bacterium]